MWTSSLSLPGMYVCLWTSVWLVLQHRKHCGACWGPCSCCLFRARQSERNAVGWHCNIYESVTAHFKMDATHLETNQAWCSVTEWVKYLQVIDLNTFCQTTSGFSQPVSSFYLRWYQWLIKSSHLLSETSQLCLDKCSDYTVGLYCRPWSSVYVHQCNSWERLQWLSVLQSTVKICSPPCSVSTGYAYSLRSASSGISLLVFL